MTAIKTPHDWWTLFDSIIPSIGIIESNIYHKRTTTDADLKEMLSSKDHKKAVEHLEKLWLDAPDKPWIHEWPNWLDLCDLCSEYWVFEDNENDCDQSS